MLLGILGVLVLLAIAVVEYRYRYTTQGFDSFAALTNWERVVLSHQTIILYKRGEYEMISEVATLADALEFEAYMYLQGSWEDKQDYLAQAKHLFELGTY